MLTGIYQKNVDAKNRIIIPQEFRTELGDEVYLTYSQNECVRVYSVENYQKLLEKIAAKKAEGVIDTTPLQFLFVMSARKVSFDTMGRVLLSGDMKDWAKLTEEAQVVGNIDHAEIWNPGKYMATMFGFSAEQTKEAVRAIGEL